MPDRYLWAMQMKPIVNRTWVRLNVRTLMHAIDQSAYCAKKPGLNHSSAGSTLNPSPDPWANLAWDTKQIGSQSSRPFITERERTQWGKSADAHWRDKTCCLTASQWGRHRGLHTHIIHGTVLSYLVFCRPKCHPSVSEVAWWCGLGLLSPSHSLRLRKAPLQSTQKETLLRDICRV